MSQFHVYQDCLYSVSSARHDYLLRDVIIRDTRCHGGQGICICCSSILTFGKIFSEAVQNFSTSKKFCEPVLKILSQYQIFWIGSIFFGFVFASNKKKYFWHLWSSLYLLSSLHLHSTYLTYFSLPALPTSQPLFFLSQYLHVPCEPWTTDLWFSFGFMSWCLTTEPWRPGCKFPYFFNYIYTIVVIHFLKLFKSDKNTVVATLTLTLTLT